MGENFSNYLKFDINVSNSEPVIKVIGVGGGGTNAVNYMYSNGIIGVDFIVCNTDMKSLKDSPVPNKIQIGTSTTKGKGAGANPEVGKESVNESIDYVRQAIEGTDMLFIAAGMGGGTGTGASPVIAKLAKEMGILTIAVVTFPFTSEGTRRKQQAQKGIRELKEYVDSLIIVRNDKLRELFGNCTIQKAYENADNVINSAVKGISQIITASGYINVDFSDVVSVMKDSGVAIMGSAVVDGQDRAMKAVKLALASPLLNDNEIKGAKNVLLYISFSSNNQITVDELDGMMEYIQNEAGNDVNIIMGHGYDDNLGDNISVVVIATGFETTPDVGFNIEEANKNKNTYELKTESTEVNVSENIVKDRKNKNEEIYVIKMSDVENNLQDETNNVENSKEINDIITKPVVNTYTKPVVDEIDTEVSYHSVGDNKEDERRRTLNNISLKSEDIDFDDINGIEKMYNEISREPAFIRQGIKLSDNPSSSHSKYSKYSLFDNDDKMELGQNNSFLHDKVD